MAAKSRPAKGDGAKKSRLFKTVLEILVVTTITGSAGALFSLPPRAQTPVSPEGLAPWVEGTTIIDLPPIVTNLGAPPDTWVRLEVSVVMDANGAGPKGDVVGGEIATDFLGFMRTVTLDQLQGPVGLQNLRHDLAERASVRSGAKVTEVIFKTLVLQ